MKLESVTGKSTIYVYQDFWAQLFVYNMIQDVVQESNVIIAKEREETRGKYAKQVNVFKEQLIKIMVEPDNKIRIKKWNDYKEL